MNMNKSLRKDEKIKLLVYDQKENEYHSHDFLELVYILEGSGVHVLDGNRGIVRKGDCFIIDYGSFHQYHNLDHTRFKLINILFTPDMIDKTLVHCRSFYELTNNYMIRFQHTSHSSLPTHFVYHDRDGQVELLVRKLQAEYAAQPPGYLELMRCLLIEIIILLIRDICKQEENVLYHDSSEAVIRYVEENYMEPVTLTALSHRLNYSLPYLSKRFKEDTGMTFMQYLQKKRLEHSCRLLANTDQKVYEIAGLVGYNDIKYFCEIFQRYMKMSPKEYRRRSK